MADNVFYLVIAVLAAAVLVLAIVKGAKVRAKHGESELSVEPRTAPQQATSNPVGIKAHGIEAGRHVEASDHTGRGIDAADVKARKDVRLATGQDPKVR